MYQRFGKRLLDILLSGASIVLLSPVLAVTGLLIRIEDGRPVIYRQLRAGRAGEPFTILKFRSMRVDTPVAHSGAVGAAATVTRVGRVIRRANLDELPQLFNILRGDMSVVGPRPPLPQQTDLIELRRQGPAWHLRPGLTGLAQIKAYDGMDVATKAAFDHAYAARLTLRGDFAIIARTVLYLFKPPPTY